MEMNEQLHELVCRVFAVCGCRGSRTTEPNSRMHVAESR